LLLSLAVNRRHLLVSVGLLGVACVGTDARWLGEDALQFQWSLFGSILWQGDRAQFASAVQTWTPWIASVGALLALSLGFAAARAVGRKGVLAGLVFALLFFFSVDPASLQFVATRGAGSAARYLDIGDLVRALGWGAIALTSMGLWSRASAGSATPREDSGRRWVVLACALAALVPTALSQLALGGEPLTNDGAAYRFQAELFADGELSREIGALSDFFPARQVMPGAQAFSKYPPGHSAVLAVGEFVGMPWLLPSLLAPLVPLLTWLLARRLGLRAPHRAALLVAISPVFLGVESLWLSHSTSVPMCLLFSYAVLAASDELSTNRNRAICWGLIGGAVLSIAFAARPLTALAVAISFALYFVSSAGRGALLVSATALVGFLPGAAFFLWINQQLTGSPFQTAYGMYADAVSPNDRYGFANLGTALSYTRFNLARLTAWLNGVAPGIWLVAVGCLAPARPKRAALLWLPALSLLSFYSLHRFHGIPWVGPLYLVEAVPLLAVLGAVGWNVLEERFGVVALRALAVTLCLASTQLVANHFVLASEHVAARSLPERLAERQGIERGVIFVPIESENARRGFALPPPLQSDDLIFARDLGARNSELLAWLPDREAWVLDLDREELVALRR